MAAGRRYQVLDVFTDQPLAGNPLGVVLDAEGLDDAAMLRIANEFNLSETIFVLPPEKPGHSARIRIFTPFYEMPFAGHPTVGGAVAVAMRNEIDAGILVLEENIGPVRCAVSNAQGRRFAEFTLPKLPAAAPFEISREAAAAALGIDPHEIGFENHRVSAWDAGVPYVTIPVANLGVAGKAKLDPALWLDMTGGLTEARAPAAYVYCRQTTLHDSDFHCRMFAGHVGLVEDPATGSAAAAFAGAVHHFDRPVDGEQTHVLEQGVEMGRPSRIQLTLVTQGGRLVEGRIGGHAVVTAEGQLFV
ncbi:PhzF family phenazine biosynthesis protein [Salmonella enterica subsp. enterica]|nr:PhzF family phenazine biosynthesis protein [Salmonella enterica subsp. enterica serovar Enteritidis]